MVETSFLFQAEYANGFQQAQGAYAVNVGGVFGALEADRNVGLGAKVINFVRLRFLHDAHQVTGVRKVTVMQLEVRVLDVRILVDMVNPLGVK